VGAMMTFYEVIKHELSRFTTKFVIYFDENHGAGAIQKIS